MAGNWRLSIGCLKGLIKDGEFPGNGDESEQHIQSLIECIVGLGWDQTKRKLELEEATINFGRLKHRYRILKDKHQVEMMAAIASARRENVKSVIEMRKIAEGLEGEVVGANQLYKRLKLENEVLSSRAEDAKRMWPQLCDMMCVIMRKKAQMQITVNETRCKIMEARHRVVLLGGDTEHLKVDISKYRRQSFLQGSRIMEEAEDWKKKISEQDAVTSQAKSRLNAKEEEVTYSKMRNNKAASVYEDARSKFESRKSQVESLGRKLTSKRREKRQQEHYVIKTTEEMKVTQKDYDEKAAEVSRLDAETMSEARGVFSDNEVTVVGRDTTRNKLEDTRFQLKTITDDRRVQRNLLLEANNLMNMMVGERATCKSEKMRLKKRLIGVVEQRDQMERMFSINLNKLSADHEREQELRVKAEGDCSDSVNELQIWKEENEKFYKDAYDVIERNRRLKDGLAEKMKELREDLDGRVILEAGLDLRVSEDGMKMQRMVRGLVEAVRMVEDNVAVMEVDVKELRRQRDEIEPNYCVIADDYDVTSKDYKRIRDRLVELNRDRKFIVDGIEQKKNIISGLEEPRRILRDEIRHKETSLLRQITEQKAELRHSSNDVYELMKLCEKLHQQNKIFEESCGRLNDDVTADLRDIESAKREIQNKMTSLTGLRAALTQLIAEETPMSSEAFMRDERHIREYEAIKACAENRGRKLSSAASRLRQLVDKFAVYATDDVTTSDDDAET
ncbi:uncharacterized protein LOC100180560 isoform X2 [Ciona intestinalis]